MSNHFPELLKAISCFKNAQMLVIGDLIVDHYVWGKVERISPEAPVVVVRVTEENRRLGGAGNVVNNLVALGAKVSVCGVRGRDDSGTELGKMFAELGVDTGGIVEDSDRQTTVKTRVIAHAQQVVRVDREDTIALSNKLAEKVTAEVGKRIEKSQGIIVSDYGKGVITESLFLDFKRRRDSRQIGFGVRPLLVDPKAPNFPLYTSSTVIKPNRAEAAQACGFDIGTRKDALRAGEILLKKWNADMVLITLGEDGMALVSGRDDIERAIEIDTVARDVYDVSGAGDTVSAVFSLSLAIGATPRVAAELANYAAGIVVAEVGTVAVSAVALRQAVEAAAEESI